MRIFSKSDGSQNTFSTLKLKMKTLFYVSILVFYISLIGSCYSIDENENKPSGGKNQHKDEFRRNQMDKEIAQAIRSITASENVTEALIREAIESKYNVHAAFKRKFDTEVKKEQNYYNAAIKWKKQSADEMMKLTRDRTAALKKNITISKNETDLYSDYTYVRQLSCPRRLKFCLVLREPTEDQIEAQRKLETKLVHLLEPAEIRRNLSSYVRQFTNTNTTSAIFAETWTMLKNLPNGLHSTPALAPVDKPAVQVEFNVSDTDSVRLCDALIDLYNATSPSIAEQLWIHQRESVWKPRSRFQHLTCWEDEGVVRWLTRARKEHYPRVASQAVDDDLNANLVQYWYALDVLTNEKLNFQKGQYKSCLWSVYDPDRLEELQKQWPEMDRAERTDLYCTKYDSFYDMATLLGYDWLNQYPKPTLKQLQEYVRFLTKERGETAGYVARTVLLNTKDS